LRAGLTIQPCKMVIVKKRQKGEARARMMMITSGTDAEHLGCNSVLTCRCALTFRMNIVPSPTELPEDTGRMFLRNSGACLQVYTASQPTRTTSISSPLRKPQTTTLGQRFQSRILCKSSAGLFHTYSTKATMLLLFNTLHYGLRL
jgi:hypothetical protein